MKRRKMKVVGAPSGGTGKPKLSPDEERLLQAKANGSNMAKADQLPKGPMPPGTLPGRRDLLRKNGQDLTDIYGPV